MNVVKRLCRTQRIYITARFNINESQVEAIASEIKNAVLRKGVEGILTEIYLEAEETMKRSRITFEARYPDISSIDQATLFINSFVGFGTTQYQRSYRCTNIFPDAFGEKNPKIKEIMSRAFSIDKKIEYGKKTIDQYIRQNRDDLGEDLEEALRNMKDTVQVFARDLGNYSELKVELWLYAEERLKDMYHEPSMAPHS